MILKRVVEAKTTDSDKALIGELKAFNEKLHDLRDETLINMVRIYKKENPEGELTKEKISEWFDEVKDLAEFVFFYSKDLSTYSISDIVEHDEKLLNAFRKVLKDYHIIDENDVDLTTSVEDGKRPKKLNPLEMCQIVLDVWAEVPVERRKDISNIPAIELSDKVVKDPLKRLNNMKEVEQAYHDLFESLTEAKHVCEKCGKEPCICEAAEEVKEIEETEIEEEPAEEVKEEEVVEIEEEPKIDIEEEPSKREVEEIAYVDLVNSAIKQTWELISLINSLIATFDYDYKEDNKEDIMELLNQISDDDTITVGMLHKVLELVSYKTGSLLASGETKAEEIID